MQIKEDPERNLFHLHPIYRKETSSDMKFLHALITTVRLHDMLAFDCIEPAKYFDKEKSRLALRFKPTKGSDSLHLVATDKEDERILQKIIFAFVDGHPKDQRPRGIYLYEHGIIQNDHRHRLNGVYASVCLAFCQYCKKPLIDRLAVRQNLCTTCKEMSPDDLMRLIESRRTLKGTHSPGLKGVWTRIKRFTDVAGSL